MTRHSVKNACKVKILILFNREKICNIMKKEAMLISDYKDNNKVAQANDLITQARGDLNLVPLKMLKLLISCVDTENPPSDYSVYVKRTDFTDFLNVKGKGSYDYIKKQLDMLIRPVDLISPRGKKITVALLKKHDWREGNSLVKCTFDEDIWEYLVDLKKNFLQYELLQIQGFNSKFSLILYENLLAMTRQSQSKIIVIPVSTLRRLTGTENKYSKFKDFEKNVLKVAQDEINSSTFLEFLFSYTKNKEGRSNEEITFRLKRRTSFTDTLKDTEYPERLDDDI